MNGRVWSAASVECVKLNWGMRSASEIAAILNVGLRGRRFTRNMVIGKADRLGLSMTREQRVAIAKAAAARRSGK